MTEPATTVRVAVPCLDPLPGAAQKYGIVIADHSPIYRAGLRSILERVPECAVIGEASDALGALRLVNDRRPDVLLLELVPLECPDLEVLVEIARRHPALKTILLVEQIDRAAQMESLRLGVRGIVFKRMPLDLIRKSIRIVATGGYWLDRDTVRDLLDAVSDSDAMHRDVAPTNCDLTPREWEIVALVARGYTNRDIARQCSITEDTVKRHITNVFDKTGRSSRLELTLLATIHP